MTVHLVTGHLGNDHITSADAGKTNSETLGKGTYILSGCECSIKDANTVHVNVGVMLLNGRYAIVDGSGVDVAISSGSVGQTRKDFIVARYELGSNGIESLSIIAKKGAAGGADPEYVSGDILNGDSVVEVPLYSVTLNGITVGTPEKIIASYSYPSDRLPVVPISKGGTNATTAANARANLGLGAMATKGALYASDIPSLDASKIASGTFNAALIPNLDASKIASGTVNASRIPNIDASKVTSGTLDSARIPTLTTAKLSDAGNLAKMSVRGGTVTVNMPKGSISNTYTIPFSPAFKATPFGTANVKTNRSFYVVIESVTASSMVIHVRSVTPYSEAFNVGVLWQAIGLA